MLITITIETCNDAFGDNTETARPEIIRILKDQANKFRFYPLDGLSQQFDVKDFNGNTVGKVEISY